MEDIQGYVGFELIGAFRAHHLWAERALGMLGLRPSQELIVLHLCREEGLSQSALAGLVGVEQPTMSVMLRRMEKAGFVERRQDIQDARLSRVYLTEQGRSMEEPIREIWHELEQRMLIGLTQSEQILLRRLLMHARSNLS